MMTLYSGTTCPFSHRCRFVLYEKGGDFEVIDVDVNNKPPEIDALNPYGEVPILIERDLTLYQSNIINEYIDERFLHRAADRRHVQAPAHGVRQNVVLRAGKRRAVRDGRALRREALARQQIREQLVQLSPILSKNKYLMGDDFTMLDITLAPLLWRLGIYGIELPKTAAPLLKYAETVFSRNSFIDSMTPSEKVMRR